MPWNHEKGFYEKDFLNRRRKAGLLAAGAAVIGLGVLKGRDGGTGKSVKAPQEMVNTDSGQKYKPGEASAEKSSTRSLMEMVASNLSKENPRGLVMRPEEEEKTKEPKADESSVFGDKKENLSDEEVLDYAETVLDGLRRYGSNSTDSLWFRNMEITWGSEFIEISKEVQIGGQGTILKKLREKAIEIEDSEPLLAAFIYSQIGKNEEAKILFQRHGSLDQLAEFYEANIDKNFGLPSWMRGIVDQNKSEAAVLENLKSLEQIFGEVSPDVKAVILERIAKSLNLSYRDREGSVSDDLFNLVSDFVKSNQEN